MGNEIELMDIADDLLILNKRTVDTLMELDNCADCIALYVFYYKTAKWQKTNQVKASDEYVKKCLKWGRDKIAKTKTTLKENGLIEIVQTRKDNKISGWYIKVGYLVNKKKIEDCKVQVNNTQNQQVGNPTSTGEDINALKQYIKCLETENEMLKEGKAPKKKNNSQFVPPTLQEVRDYCFERNNTVDPEKFISYYESNGWKVGRNKMKDWKAAVRTWERNQKDSRNSVNKKAEELDNFYGMLGAWKNS